MIDPLLAQQRLIDVSEEAGTLPLLAYTLRQLVEDNRGGADGGRTTLEVGHKVLLRWPRSPID